MIDKTELNDYNAKWLKLAAMIRLGMEPAKINYEAEWHKMARKCSNRKTTGRS